MVTKVATRMSSLNPNAPLFIPAAFLAAEDFSAEWWDLVHTSPAFRDYWLRERSDIMEIDTSSVEVIDEFEAIDELLDIQIQTQMEELQNADDLAHFKQDNGTTREVEKDLVSALVGMNMNGLSSPRVWRDPMKHHEKIANKALRSRGNQQYRIQQPRP